MTAIVGIVQTVAQRREGLHHLLKLHPFPTQLLGPIGGVPDNGIFQLSDNFGQTLAFGVMVKDTPSELRRALAYL